MNKNHTDNHDICWIVNEYRNDQRTGALSPIVRSDYAQLLFDKGAGFHEQRRNREYLEGLQLDDKRN
ncbi:hypothetical protein [Virgibacillus salexigens]|uniref:hypothetical protein n=1 Tax=Virgibacillus TaxID=84406 RepID=UPI00137122CC|nr:MULTISPECIES: hypothetical protein [Virgibacillus]MYL43575.1 hypothetical protein [Virgibacillus massiliensis]